MSGSYYHVGVIHGQGSSNPLLRHLWAGMLGHHSLAISLQDVPLRGK